MASAREIIRGCLLDIGRLEAGRTPAAEDADDCLIALNNMADSLGLERLTLYSRIRTTKVLSSGTASYSIGSGGDINLDRPIWIDHASLVIDTSAAEPSEVPLSILTLEEFAAWPMKTLQSSQPMAIFYDYGLDTNSRGLIYPLPIPDVGTTQLVLYTPGGQVATFADLDTPYALPRGLKRALQKNLAMEVCPMFGATPSRELVAQANDSKSAFKMANYRPLPMRPEDALVGNSRGHWSINTDGRVGGWE